MLKKERERKCQKLRQKSFCDVPYAKNAAILKPEFVLKIVVALIAAILGH